MGGLNTIFVLTSILVFFTACVLPIEGVCNNGQVAFEAHITDRIGPFPLNSVLIFPVTTLNEGNGYNPHNGHFTAPTCGVYMFSVHVCQKNKQDMVATIKKGNTQLASTSLTGDGSGCASVSTVVRLEEGDVVRIVSDWLNSYIFANGHRWNSFIGYLVYK